VFLHVASEEILENSGEFAVMWRTENTLMNGRIRSRKFRDCQMTFNQQASFGARSEARQRDRCDGVHDFLIGVDDDPSTRQPRARLESVAIGVARRKGKRKDDEQGLRSRDGPGREDGPVVWLTALQEKGEGRRREHCAFRCDCNKFLNGNFKHLLTSFEENETDIITR